MRCFPKVWWIPLILGFTPAASQNLGGAAVFSFLDLPASPQLTGLGGINISQPSSDIGLSFYNPALLRSSAHEQLATVFNSFYGGIRNYHLAGGYQHEPWNTVFSAGVNYIDYGSIPQTDASGNVLGEFRPVDYVIQVSAARAYLNRWHYGATVKFIHSGYGPFRSSGMALDVGVTYTDSSHFLQASLLARNMGAQLTVPSGSSAGNLPFDLQLGISKKLENAPVSFSLTAHHLHQFDIRYSDSSFNADLGSGNDPGKSFFFDKLFRHIVLSTQVILAERVELSLGYNYLRRKELNIGNSGNGLNGLSFSAGVLFKKIQIRYAHSYYQNQTGYNQFGINILAEAWRKKKEGN